MVCDFASLQMNNRPSTICKGFLSSFHRTHGRCSTLYPSEKLVLNPLPYRSYFCGSAVRDIETFNQELSYERTTKRFRPINELKELQSPRREHSIDKGSDRIKGSAIGCGSVDRLTELKLYSEKLKNCTFGLFLREGRMIHGRIVRSEIDPDMHLWVSLINLYAKCGALESSRHVFDQMPVKEVVSWTALISGFVSKGYGIKSLELYSEMRRENIRPNEFTLATVLKGCSMISDLELGKQLHAEVVKIDRLSDVYVGSVLVDLYSKCGEMEYAENVFRIIPQKNVVSWNSLLNGYAQVGNGVAVLKLFSEISELEMRLSYHTLSIVLKGLANSGDSYRAGQAVHSIVIKIGGEFDDYVCCSLVKMYSNCGLANDACKAFKRIKDPDIVSWSSIISVLDQQGEKEEAVEFFHLMRRSGMRPNQFTLASIVSAATDLNDLRFGRSVHALAHKFGFESDDLVCNALIAMYMKFRSISDGFVIFEKMTERDVVSWNALLSGFHDDGDSDQGIVIFKKMIMENYRPNKYSFISILRSCSSLANLEFGKQVHSRIIKDGFVHDPYVGTALIDMYAKCGRTEYVETIFNRLIEKDIFTWTVMISCYSQTNQGEKAALCFNLMRREGVEPNEFTIASSLRACSGIASLENGRQLHSLVLKSGHSFDMFVASALIDMYGKCGQIDDSETLFNDISSGDTILWNTMICLYSQHGLGLEALQEFEKMIREGVGPDRVTFVGVLSACSHMGFVEEGKEHFESMSKFGIDPGLEHYACMVDILGRAGKFDEVEKLIEGMDLAPNTSIWESVLGACRAHGNVELGEKAAKKLFEIEPETDSNYILLSNLYASNSMWDDVSKIRASMTSKGVKKEPGCSWVEFDARVNVFLSQDSTHPRLSDIHRKLEELGREISELGYVPNTSHVLQNVTEKEKRENLSHHSERLALGFALISKVGNRRIRIFKNLRICGDCHEFMKFVSGIVNREIVVRDINRFHHFRDGSCSCKDYW